MQEADDNVHQVSHSTVIIIKVCYNGLFLQIEPSLFHFRLTADNVGCIWGIAQSTNNSVLINACLPLLSTDIPRLLKLKLNIDQLMEVLQLPLVKDIGGEHQLRLAAN